MCNMESVGCNEDFWSLYFSHFATHAPQNMYTLLCNTRTLQHTHFTTSELCNTCTLQNVQFAK